MCFVFKYTDCCVRDLKNLNPESHESRPAGSVWEHFKTFPDDDSKLLPKQTRDVTCSVGLQLEAATEDIYYF